MTDKTKYSNISVNKKTYADSNIEKKFYILTI